MAAVDIDSLKPNSHLYKEGKEKGEEKDEKEKLKPIVKKGGVVSTRKPLGKQFAETFIEEDIKEVKKYVIWDVVIPGIKHTILDMLSMMFFKESYYGGGRSSRDDHYSYSARYKYKEDRSRRRSDSRRRDRDEDEYESNSRVDYRNIVLRNRNDAEDVVHELRKRINKYDTASIADLLELVSVSSKYVDNDWGWDNENDIGVRRVSNGYLIDVAEAKLLED